MISKILKTPIYDIVKQTNLDLAPLLSKLIKIRFFLKEKMNN